MSINCNYIEKITEIYAFVSVDEGGEGIVGMTVNHNGRDMLMPFVCADNKLLVSLKESAKKLAKNHNQKIKLIKLDNRTELETYE